jgi:hypothetical protein
MKTETQTYGPQYWAALTLQTRRYGAVYVHSGARNGFGYRACEHDGMIFSWDGYGRSLQAGGHKYKVHARYADSGKPVPSKILRSL